MCATQDTQIRITTCVHPEMHTFKYEGCCLIDFVPGLRKLFSITRKCVKIKV